MAVPLIGLQSLHGQRDCDPVVNQVCNHSQAAAEGLQSVYNQMESSWQLHTVFMMMLQSAVINRLKPLTEKAAAGELIAQ